MRHLLRTDSGSTEQCDGSTPETVCFPEKAGRNNPAIILGIVLLLITATIYMPVANHPFINFDDPVYVTDNAHIADGISVQNIVWAFTSFEAGNWHPLTWLSHMADVQLYGMNPRGHHLTSVAIHTLSTLMLFLLFLRMTDAPWQSSCVAALFALHPLHVESVAWIAERKDVLSAFFGFLTLFLYVRFSEKRSVSRYLAVLASLIAGLMAKPMLVTLPLVMLLIDYWPLGRYQREQRGQHLLIAGRILLREKIPFFLCALCSGIITIYAQKSIGAVASLTVIPVRLRIENIPIAYVSYIRKTLWPDDLAIYYPLSPYNDRWQAAGAIALLLLVTVAAILIARRAPFMTAGWLWFIITLIPVIGIVQVGSQSMADRYSYIPTVGLFTMAAWGIPELFRKVRFHITVPVLLYALIIGASALTTRQQLGYWKDTITLYRHTLKVTTNNTIIHNSLAAALQAQGDLTGAIREYEEAVQINPGDKKARNNLGVIFTGRGDFDRAIQEFQLALHVDPYFDDAINNMGIALAGKGYLNAAIQEFRRGMLLKPGNWDMHFNAALVYEKKGDFDNAIQEYRETVRINPGYEQAKLKLARALAIRAGNNLK